MQERSIPLRRATAPCRRGPALPVR